MSLGLGVSISRTAKGGGVIENTSFIFTIDTENAGSATKTFVIPLVNDGVIDMNVDWGDGDTNNIVLWNDPNLTHVYAATGIYEIQISGTIRGFDFANGGDKLKILLISQWGDFNITQQGIFMGCANLTCTAADAPTIGTNDLTQTFNQCPALNGGLSGWDTSGVDSLYSMFYGCTTMNQDLSSWDVSAVESMYQFLAGCTSFNNASLANWNVSSVKDFSFAFNGATSFQGDLSTWDTGEATTMYSMFRDMTYNQDISGWDTSKVDTIGAMFRWNTSFNQDISGWDMGACTNMWGVFNYASAFDQNLGGWDIEACTEFSNFIAGGNLSTANYDALLIGWEAQSVSIGETPSFGTSKYTGGGVAATARADLIAAPNLWTITDGGIA